MSATNDAQRVFDAGVLSLGIPPIDGMETERDVDYAARAFKRATEYDPPDMCDAWLGRAAAGDTGAEVLYHLYRTSSTSLFREQRRLGASAAHAHGSLSDGSVSRLSAGHQDRDPSRVRGEHDRRQGL